MHKFILLLLVISNIALFTNAQVSSKPDCSYYCNKLSQWKKADFKHNTIIKADTHTKKKWVNYFTTLLSKCLSYGTLKLNEKCGLKKLPVPMKTKCQLDVEIVKGKCVKCRKNKKSFANKCSCNKGYSEVNKDCVRSCPKGYARDKSGSCTTNSPCPLGYHLNSKGVCYKSYNTIAACPTGFKK